MKAIQINVGRKSVVQCRPLLVVNFYSDRYLVFGTHFGNIFKMIYSTHPFFGQMLQRAYKQYVLECSVEYGVEKMPYSIAPKLKPSGSKKASAVLFSPLFNHLFIYLYGMDALGLSCLCDLGYQNIKKKNFMSNVTFRF